MRCQEREEAIVRHATHERLEGNGLQDNFALWIAEDPLLDPIAAVLARVDELEGRDASPRRTELRTGVAFLFREE
jgi:hypothetical protein